MKLIVFGNIKGKLLVFGNIKGMERKKKKAERTVGV
jgi:hypothetical protein